MVFRYGRIWGAAVFATSFGLAGFLFLSKPATADTTTLKNGMSLHRGSGPYWFAQWQREWSRWR